MKIPYLAVRKRRPNRHNPTGRINACKSILKNSLAITCGDRLTSGSRGPQTNSGQAARGGHP
jgi:hypothetical protein